MAPALWATPSPALTWEDKTERVDLWPAVTTYSEPSGAILWADALAKTKTAQFEPPKGPYANLGRHNEAVWLHIPIQTPPSANRDRWWLTIDYPSLDSAEVHVISGDKLVHQVMLGDHLRWQDRAAPTSFHAAPLALEAGQPYELLLRVHNPSGSAVIVPLALVRTAEMLAHEATIQLLQGAAAGFGVFIFLFTAARALITREVMYMWFAATCLCVTLFFSSFFGIGTQHFWPHNDWLTRNAPALFMLLMLGSGTLFVVRSLDIARYSIKSARAMQAVAAMALGAAALFIADLIGYRAAAGVATALGLFPMLLAVPVAYKRAREGDRAARWAFAGWGVYAAGVVSLVMLAGGHIGAWPWAQGAYQICTLLETMAWMMVLGVRADEMRLAAEHVKREHDRVLQISQTDPLTNLLNRRGLQLGLPPLVQAATTGHLTAVYLIDLDGFKPINDTYGHDAGDELLIKMGERLKAAVRAGDLVARLGGDEFVVVASQLRGEAEAEQVGQKLLACSQTDFVLAHATCHVGMTVGYAVAPPDGTDADALVRRADNAMYGGKQAGKNRVRRATDLPAEPSAVV